MGKKLFCWNFLILPRLSIVLLLCMLSFCLQAQVDSTQLKKEAAPTVVDTLSLEDLTPVSDTLASDSGKIKTGSAKKLSPSAIEEIVKYNAEDSIRIELKSNTAYFYNKAEVYYETMELKADYLEIDFNKNELFASGIADEEGNITGHPVFKEGEYVFDAHEIKYNFSTKKGKINSVITAEGEGYIHGEQVKKLADNTSFIKKGKYTTCDLDHPHYELAFTKAKVLPNDKIVTGPVYLSFGGVPTVLALPFGYFPIQKGRKSGIISPTFGDAGTRGFFLKDFGYYFGINDNFDLALQGGIYTRGSWEAKVSSNYVVRYKFKGRVEVGLAQNLFGERNTDSYRRENDYRFIWEHRQDVKSHPNTTFAANVKVVSSKYNTYNSTAAIDYLSNQYESKITLSTNAKGIFFFDGALNYSQSTRTRQVDLSLPDMSMYVNQFYPFRKRNKVGKLKWYDNISMKWGAQVINRLNTYDSLLFKAETWKNLQSGIEHRIPITVPIKIAKAFNWTSSITLTEKWYLQSLNRDFDITYDDGDSIAGSVLDSYKRGFYALHDLALSTSLTTKVYFMYQFMKGGVKAIRHVMDPIISFTYRPNLNKGYRGAYYDPVNRQDVEYSPYQGAIFGGPYDGTQASVSIGINNRLEMKVRSKKDTITGTRKIVLIENLSISTSYDFARDSLRWIPLEITGRTTLFKQLYVTFRLSFDPYRIGANGRRINKLEKKLFRFSLANTNIGFNWTINQSLFTGKKKNAKQDNTPDPENTLFQQNQLGMSNQRPDFSSPWSITLSYNFAYTVSDDYNYYTGLSNKKYKDQIIQTISVTGDMNITKKWKIGFSTGYDFVQKDISYTSLDVYRDLHCWEMRIHWIPFGNTKGFSFSINVKASILQDVIKYNMRRNAWDQY